MGFRVILLPSRSHTFVTMCRFVAYIGPPVLAADLLYRPQHSLIRAQTIHAEEMSVTVNGDGFGIGWYVPELDNEPCVFRSIKPAWSDLNLRNLARKIYSPLIFAHVRAASPGFRVDEVNSHPFWCGRLMFMHNGVVGNFRAIRRKLLRQLNDTAYDAIMGSTDSEHLFGLLLNFISDPFEEVSCEELVEALWSMLYELSNLLMEANVREHSYLNLCVTNGTSIVATRYTTNPNAQPATLYYMYGKRYYCDGEWCGMEPTYGHPSAVVIASEPFTGTHSEWIKVERNTMMVIDETLRIRFFPIELPFERFVTEEVEVL